MRNKFLIYLVSNLVLCAVHGTSLFKWPAHFLFGFGNAEYQVSGAFNCPNTNWAVWERGNYLPGVSHIAHKQMSGKACDFWHKYEEDILRAKQLGANAFRFSVEWSVIEPQPGVFSAEAIKHYHALCDFIIAQGMTPVITLHHFTDPLWFTYQGGFEKEENIAYFVRFCTKVFSEFGHKVPIWCTINEPTIYAFMGYVLGMFPPGKHSPTIAGIVLRNLLQAHTQVYKTLKALPHGSNARIGIVHQLLKFMPYHTWNKLDATISYYFTHMTHTAAFEFLKTGKFVFRGFGKTITYEDLDAPSSYDFIGINYYSRVLMNFFRPTHAPGEIMTDYQYAIYPQGLYDAIKEMSALQVPMFITENGIADEKDSRRAYFIQQYMQALQKAIADGYDVQGYFYWTLTDNFEWHEGYTKHFGIYTVNLTTQERTLRASAQELKKIYCSKNPATAIA